MGHLNVIKVSGWVEQLRAGKISEAELTLMLYAQSPRSTAFLLTRHGGITERFLLEAIACEAEPPVGRNESGDPVFFETRRFLQSSGSVREEMASEYALVVRATEILQRTYKQHPELYDGDVIVNRCCKCPSTCNCKTVQTSATCGGDSQGNCKAGSTNCP